MYCYTSRLPATTSTHKEHMYNSMYGCISYEYICIYIYIRTRYMYTSVHVYICTLIHQYLVYTQFHLRKHTCINKHTYSTCTTLRIDGNVERDKQTNKEKNKTKQNRTKQNRTEQNKTKQNKAKQNTTKQKIHINRKQNTTKQTATKQNTMYRTAPFRSVA